MTAACPRRGGRGRQSARDAVRARCGHSTAAEATRSREVRGSGRRAGSKHLEPVLANPLADGQVLVRVDQVAEDQERAREHQCAEDEEGNCPLGDSTVALEPFVLEPRRHRRRVGRRGWRGRAGDVQTCAGSVAAKVSGALDCTLRAASVGYHRYERATNPADGRRGLEQAVVLASLCEPVVLWDEAAVEHLARREADALEELQHDEAGVRVGKIDEAGGDV